MSEAKEGKEVKVIEEKGAAIVIKAKALTIKDDESLETAKDMVRDCRSLMKEVDATFGPMKKKASAAHKEICAQEKKHLSPPEQAKKIVEDSIGVYITECNRLAQIEEERLADLRTKEVDRITKRLEKHIAQGTDIEKQLEELETKLESYEVGSPDAEATSKMIEVLATKLRNKVETIEINQVQAEEVHIAPVQTTRPSLKGVGSGRKERIPTVFNKASLIKSIAEGKAPFELLDVNMGKLKKYLNQFESAILPGVKVEEKTVVRVS